MNNTNIAVLLLAVFLTATAAFPAGSAEVNTSAIIGNVLPQITDVSVAASVNPTAGTTTTVPVTITAADNNGFQDLSAIKVTVYKPDGSTVHVAEALATSNEDGSGTGQSYAFSFDMNFHDGPATGGSVYFVRAVAHDAAGGISTALDGTFEYTELVALSLSAASLDFGTVTPGVRSATQTLAITNQGNVGIDARTSGTDLSDGNGHAIDQSNIKYDLANSDMNAEASLTDTPFTNTGFDLAKGAASSQTGYWALETPSAEAQYLPSGTYSGTLTLTAIQG